MFGTGQVGVHLAKSGGVSLTRLWVIVALSRCLMSVVFRAPGVTLGLRGYGTLVHRLSSLIYYLLGPRAPIVTQTVGMMLVKSDHSTIHFWLLSSIHSPGFLDNCSFREPMSSTMIGFSVALVKPIK